MLNLPYCWMEDRRKEREIVMKKYNVCVLGATGLVGGEMLKILVERNFPYDNLTALATSKSAGKIVEVGDLKLTVKDADLETFENMDVALFAGGEIASEEYGKKAVKAGCVVIDNSAFFRMHEDVPLVVPEVNPDDIFKHKGIIANPNCSTIQMVVALKPIYDAVGIKRIVVSTYQSVSGTGKNALTELKNQAKAVLEGKEIEKPVSYPHQIAFNLIPQIGSFGENGYSSEEMKMINETKKIIGDQNIAITATTVRVPTEFGHCESINIETVKPITAEEVKKLMSNAKGVKLVDNLKESLYPMTLSAAHTDFVEVGRIRKDISCENGIEMWISADNIRKGAALNAVQIAEKLFNI